MRRRQRRQRLSDVHRPLGQTGEEPGQEALASFRIGDELGVEVAVCAGRIISRDPAWPPAGGRVWWINGNDQGALENPATAAPSPPRSAER
jgi:hypothetical protein